MDGIDRLYRMFEDQRIFNELVWKSTDRSEQEIIERFRVLSLGMTEENVEFLRTFEYKAHRRYKGKLPNVAHSHEELVDMFKYWLSLAALSGFPISRLEEYYNAKTLVVQYRHQEEWVKEVTGPSVVVDIDEVLADYRKGMCDYIKEWGSKLLKLPTPALYTLVSKLAEVTEKGLWINNETLGLSTREWQVLKHEFRSSGHKRYLPAFKDARIFLEWCRSKGWLVILITSRPIDRYPNLFTDTVNWLNDYRLPFDLLWWATEKGDRLDESHVRMLSQIQFAVDDSPRFVAQFRNKGIRTYLLDRYAPTDVEELRVNSLTMLMEMEDERWLSKTHDTDPTQSTRERNPLIQSPTDPNRLTFGS